MSRIIEGQLRWVQNYDSIQPETPPYHLSWNGTLAVCGVTLYPGSESNIYEEALNASPPEPRCPDCLAAIQSQLGLR